MMSRTGFTIFIGMLVSLGGAVLGWAQKEQANLELAGGTAFNAALSQTLDTKKCQPGDPVKAKTTEPVKSDGKTVLPKGTELIGHVTQASARGKGAPDSKLGLTFDKAILKGGKELPLNVALQAIASPQAAALSRGMDTMGGGGTLTGVGMGAGRGPMGGMAPGAGGAPGTMANPGAGAGGSMGEPAGAPNGGMNAEGQLAQNSQGVIGLQGMTLNSAGANGARDNVITSTGKNVRLDSGTRMLLVVAGQAGQQQSGTAKQPEKGKP